MLRRFLPFAFLLMIFPSCSTAAPAKIKILYRAWETTERDAKAGNFSEIGVAGINLLRNDKPKLDSVTDASVDIPNGEYNYVHCIATVSGQRVAGQFLTQGFVSNDTRLINLKHLGKATIRYTEEEGSRAQEILVVVFEAEVAKKQ